MQVYTFNPVTMELTGIEEVQESPLEQGVWLIPSNATTVAPATTGTEKEKQVFDKEKNTWSLVEDHRQHMDIRGRLFGGTPYWLPSDSFDSEPKYVTTLGPLPKGALLERPAKTLAQAKEEKIASINNEVSEKIVSGFLYKGYKYSYDRDDQQNFADTAVAAQQLAASGVVQTIKWNSYNTNGGLVIQTLTPVEFLDLYMSGALTHKQTCMLEATTRKDKVQKATSVSEVEKI